MSDSGEGVGSEEVAGQGRPHCQKPPVGNATVNSFSTASQSQIGSRGPTPGNLDQTKPEEDPIQRHPQSGQGNQKVQTSGSSATDDHSPLADAPFTSAPLNSDQPSPGSGPPNAVVCTNCHQRMGGQFVRALNGAFHLECFNCLDCGQTVAAKFFPIDDPDGRQYPLCEQDYFRRLGLICHSCGGALRSSYITALDKKYHVEHFTCSVCPTVFGPHDSYYEHEGNVYCHYHYSVRYAVKCAGCQTAILKQFVEINKAGSNEHWHPECYMIHKFWNVKLVLNNPAGDLEPLEGPNGEVPTAVNNQLKARQKSMEDKVYQIWTVLSAFEESSAACISDMLIHVSNGASMESVRMADSFVLHVEILFAALDDLEQQLNAAGDSTGLQYGKEPKMLCKKVVSFFSILSHTPDSGVRRMGITQELLSLVTGLAHFLKILIRVALTSALKLERVHNSPVAIANFLGKLMELADSNSEASSSATAPASLANAGGDQQQLLPFSDTMSDLCYACHLTIEEQCVRLGPLRWHLNCISCRICKSPLGNAKALPGAKFDSSPSDDHTGVVYCSNCAPARQGSTGFEMVSQLQQYTFLLRVALKRLYNLLKIKDTSVADHDRVARRPSEKPEAVAAAAAAAATAGLVSVTGAAPTASRVASTSGSAPFLDRQKVDVHSPHRERRVPPRTSSSPMIPTRIQMASVDDGVFRPLRGLNRRDSRSKSFSSGDKFEASPSTVTNLFKVLDNELERFAAVDRQKVVRPETGAVGLRRRASHTAVEGTVKIGTSTGKSPQHAQELPPPISKVPHVNDTHNVCPLHQGQVEAQYGSSPQSDSSTQSSLAGSLPRPSLPPRLERQNTDGSYHYSARRRTLIQANPGLPASMLSLVETSSGIEKPAPVETQHNQQHNAPDVCQLHGQAPRGAEKSTGTDDFGSPRMPGGTAQSSSGESPTLPGTLSPSAYLPEPQTYFSDFSLPPPHIDMFSSASEAWPGGDRAAAGSGPHGQHRALAQPLPQDGRYNAGPSTTPGAPTSVPRRVQSPRSVLSVRGKSQTPFLTELSALEMFIVRHLAVLSMAPLLGHQIPLEELMELLGGKKPSLFSRMMAGLKASKRPGKAKGTFGVPLEQLVERGVDSDQGPGPGRVRLPAFLDESLAALRSMDVGVEGIFRKNGNIKGLREVSERLDRDPGSVDLRKMHPVQLAALLKKFLRELPDPVLTHKLHRVILASQQVQDEEARQKVLHFACCLLPRAHRDTLEALLCFFRWVASHEERSKMGIEQLASVIAPNILHGKGKDSELADSLAVVGIVERLLEDAEEFCTVPEDLAAILNEHDFVECSVEKKWPGGLIRVPFAPLRTLAIRAPPHFRPPP